MSSIPTQNPGGESSQSVNPGGPPAKSKPGAGDVEVFRDQNIGNYGTNAQLHAAQLNPAH